MLMPDLALCADPVTMLRPSYLGPSLCDGKCCFPLCLDQIISKLGQQPFAYADKLCNMTIANTCLQKLALVIMVPLLFLCMTQC